MSRKAHPPIQVNVHVENLEIHEIIGQQEKAQDTHDDSHGVLRPFLHFISALLIASVPALLSALLK